MNKKNFLCPKRKEKKKQKFSKILTNLHNAKNKKEIIKELIKDIHENIDILYELATKDEKTGLYNNKFFDSVFDIEFAEAKRGKKLCLSVIDIDYFKKINDKIGHIKADFLLLKLSNLLKKSLRKSDIVARFGGEEFFILISGAKLSKAKKVIERIRKKVESDLIFKKNNLTISAGISEFKNSDTKLSFKKRADSALYLAKEKGRNKVCSL